MSECKTCGKPLTVEIDLEEEDNEYDEASASEKVVPDSVELQCGCYFHWCVPLPWTTLQYNDLRYVMVSMLTMRDSGNVYLMPMR